MAAGGRRPGAGRKPKDDKREQVTLYVTPATGRRMDKLRGHGLNIRNEFEAHLQELCVAMGLESQE